MNHERAPQDAAMSLVHWMMVHGMKKNGEVKSMKVESAGGKREREKETRKKRIRKESGCLLLGFLSSCRQMAFMSLIAFSVLKHTNGSFT